MPQILGLLFIALWVPAVAHAAVTITKNVSAGVTSGRRVHGVSPVADRSRTGIIAEDFDSVTTRQTQAMPWLSP